MAANAAIDRTMLPNAPSLMIRMPGARCAAGTGFAAARIISLRMYVGGGKMFDPVPGNVEAARNPDAVKATYVVDQLLQTRSTRRMAHNPHVQTEGQHFRLRPSLLVKEVERVAAVMEEVIAGRKRAASEL